MKFFAQKYYPIIIIVVLFIAGLSFVLMRGNSKIIKNSSSLNNDSVSFASPSKMNVHADVKNQLRELEIAVEKNPKNVSHLNMVATFLMDAHNHKDAIPYFERAIVLDPKNEASLLDLSVCYSQINDYEHALKTTDKLLRIHPNQPTALYNKGALFATMGKNSDAVKIWKTLLLVAPQSTEAKKASEGISILGSK